VERQVDEQYIKTGVVRFGYLQFAVLGPESEWAAQASECAGDQRAFWPYHDKLYTSQQGENQATFSKENLKSMAAALKLDVTAFNQCLDSSKYAAQVAQETDAGQSIGVRATPTFLVNGRTIQGALPLAQFEEVIEEARGSAK
jgi:protein-disulfide isomerase